MQNEESIQGRNFRNRPMRIKNYFSTGDERYLIGWYVETLSDDHTWVVSSNRFVNKDTALAYAELKYGFTQ
jgi:hypothetical protein